MTRIMKIVETNEDEKGDECATTEKGAAARTGKEKLRKKRKGKTKCRLVTIKVNYDKDEEKNK